MEQRTRGQQPGQAAATSNGTCHAPRDTTLREAAPVNGRKAALLSRPETPPATLPVQPENVPAKLKARDQWVVWRWKWREGTNGKPGKWTKEPYRPREPSRPAKVNDSSTWGTFDEALAVYRAGRADGIGFVFAEDDPYCGVDLDDCRDPATGEVAGWARPLVADLDSYSERSPTGTGAKVYLRARHAGPGHRLKYATGEVEVYDKARFFAVTGRRLDGSPVEVNDRQEQLLGVWQTVLDAQPPRKARARRKARPPAAQPQAALLGPLTDEQVIEKASACRRSGGAFKRLWAGDTSGHGDDDSSADLALCNYLRFWSGDRDQVDRLFRQSGLMRDKWDATHSGDGRSYGEMTLDKAMPGDVCSPRPGGKAVCPSAYVLATPSQEEEGEGPRPPHPPPVEDNHTLTDKLGLHPPPWRPCPRAQKRLEGRRGDRSRARVACLPCRNLTCPVCFSRRVYEECLYYVGKLMAHGRPVTVGNVQAPAWGSLSRAIRRAGGDFAYPEVTPGLRTVFATVAMLPGGETVSAEDACRRLVSLLLSMKPRTAPRSGKKLVQPSKAWKPPRKRGKSEWEVIGKVMARHPGPVVSLLIERGLEPAVKAEPKPAGGPEWVISWRYPPDWSGPQMDVLNQHLALLAG